MMTVAHFFWQKNLLYLWHWLFVFGHQDMKICQTTKEYCPSRSLQFFKLILKFM